MSTPDQPDSPALTRRQLRELRQTGAVPVVTPDDATSDEPSAADAAVEPAVEEAPAPVAAPLPRAAEPAVIPPAPTPDAAVDLGTSPLTRRQARQQERIRTASVPVITPDLASQLAEPAPVVDAVPAAEPEAPAAEADGAAEAAADIEAADTAAEAEAVEETPDTQPEEAASALQDASVVAESPAEIEDRPLVHPELGAELLGGEPVSIETPPSFDQLLSRSATGSVAATNALILSQTPASAPIDGPVTSTGEILITGTFNLPEGLGSTGHAVGTADGKEVDAVLVDGELPAHSSPTPIAASAAISTVKSAGEIIQPPAPEKGSRLMLTLAITAGVLAVALVGVLIVAIVTGVFQ
ncbi:hypothetical protein ACFQRL_07695 [Microbacterium fluvii]|uniref:Uncharacterized protein n=1 Tax=Microbacterium fluvii TaxID=415215 RepID=A0ABW2HE85_9MICO|nr:hypothetical protein [Microbacterium fluvii]MCU4672469.1 hypothetical protein [Microbacterium fluvii]